MRHALYHYKGGSFFHDVFETWCGKIIRALPWYANGREIDCDACNQAFQAFWAQKPQERIDAWRNLLVSPQREAWESRIRKESKP